MLEDKVFYCFKITNLTDTLIEVTKEGENQWMTREQMVKEERIFRDNVWIVDNIEREGLFFMEERHEMENL